MKLEWHIFVKQHFLEDATMNSMEVSSELHHLLLHPHPPQKKKMFLCPNPQNLPCIHLTMLATLHLLFWQSVPARHRQNLRSLSKRSPFEEAVLEGCCSMRNACQYHVHIYIYIHTHIYIYTYINHKHTIKIYIHICTILKVVSSAHLWNGAATGSYDEKKKINPVFCP